jgi:hypothetical protein
MITSFFIFKTSKLNGEEVIPQRNVIFEILYLIGLSVVSADLKQPATGRQGKNAIGAR